MTMTLIYHMADSNEWEAAQNAGVYLGTENDKKDGFIHFSTAETVVESAAKHRAGEPNLLLITVESDALGMALKWEEARGGALFPHLYGPLKMSDVMKVEDLPLGPDGLHKFPPVY
ncbi:DUF952 domain-containing protein [Sneathiella aquimaris]|uniref:DUF952 domain-containing protein n=1 Tax=Sneathiella aquimaris TaxID=2599305 RepID=UPI00146AFB78